MEIIEVSYRAVCYATWGSVPVDKAWATETAIFKEMQEKMNNEIR